MKTFPILIGCQGTKGPCPSSIPWDAIAPYEEHAKANHDQTLERLAERGGLGPVEAYFVMTGRTWRNVQIPVSDELEREACAFLDGVVKDPIRIERDGLLLQVEVMRRVVESAVEFVRYIPGSPEAHDAALFLIAAINAYNNRAVEAPNQGSPNQYHCLACDWSATSESRPLSRGTKVGCPKCGGDAYYGSKRAGGPEKEDGDARHPNRNH